MGTAAPRSALAAPEVLDYLADVLVQDACDMLLSTDAKLRAAAESNPVHQFLLTLPDFRCAADHHARCAGTRVGRSKQRGACSSSGAARRRACVWQQRCVWVALHCLH